MSIKDWHDPGLQKAMGTLESAMDRLNALREPKLNLRDRLCVIIEDWYEDQSGQDADEEKARQFATTVAELDLPRRAIKAYCAVVQVCDEAYGETGYSLWSLVTDLIDEIGDYEEEQKCKCKS